MQIIYTPLKSLQIIHTILQQIYYFLFIIPSILYSPVS